MKKFAADNPVSEGREFRVLPAKRLEIPCRSSSERSFSVRTRGVSPGRPRLDFQPLLPLESSREPGAPRTRGTRSRSKTAHDGPSRRSEAKSGRGRSVFGAPRGQHAANGARCRMVCRSGRRCITISAAGGRMAPGAKCTTPCAGKSAKPWAARRVYDTRAGAKNRCPADLALSLYRSLLLQSSDV